MKDLDLFLCWLGIHRWFQETAKMQRCIVEGCCKTRDHRPPRVYYL